MTRRDPVTPDNNEAVAHLEAEYDDLPAAKDWHPKERTVPDWIHQLPETGGRS